MQKISLLTLSVLATAALAAERFVGPTGGPATAAGNALGVACTDAASGALVACDVLGTAIVTAGGAIAAGALVEVGTNGKAVAKTTGVAVGRALQLAGADGDRIEVLLLPN